MTKTLYIFPGQGSQYPGMGKDLHSQYECVRDIYQKASDTLGYDIAELSFSSSDEIHLTEYTQPVLLTHSIACLEAFKECAGTNANLEVAGGHSLGEYTSLVAAGVLSFETALQLVKERGQLMGDLGQGEMLALQLGVDSVRDIASKHHCAIAACNLPEQTVVGGVSTDLERLSHELKELFPKKSAVQLKTEGAFHTYYMVAAALKFRPVLDAANFNQSDVDVLSNFTGSVHGSDTDSVRANLFWQLFYPVLWYQNLITAHDLGVDAIVEFGGGIGSGEEPAAKKPNLAGIVKRAYRGRENPPSYRAVINCETLASAVEALTS